MMKVKHLLYYIANLVIEGHKWQYKNALGEGKPFKGYFSKVQYFFLLLGVIFSIENKEGLSVTTTDLLLSTLGILIGLFLALVVIVYDKFKNQTFDTSDINKKIKSTKLWNILCQYNALISYAILIGLFLVLMLIGNLFWGKNLNINDFYCVRWPNIHKTDVPVTIYATLTFIARVSIVYFILDFIYISIFAVVVLFQVLRLDMKEKKLSVNDARTIEDDTSATRKVRRVMNIFRLICYVFVICVIVYIFCSHYISAHIQKC